MNIYKVLTILLLSFDSIKEIINMLQIKKKIKNNIIFIFFSFTWRYPKKIDNIKIKWWNLKKIPKIITGISNIDNKILFL